MEGVRDVGPWRAWRASGAGGPSRSRFAFTVSESVVIFQFSHAEVRALDSKELNILL